MNYQPKKGEKNKKIENKTFNSKGKMIVPLVMDSLVQKSDTANTLA